jgi:ribose 5-phosphate isomerase RpiB
VCLGSRVVGQTVAVDALEAYLAGVEEGGRHEGRIAKLTALDRGLVHDSEGTP